MTSNRLYSFLILFLFCGSVYAQENLADFTDKSVPVLNENLRSMNANVIKSKNLLNEYFSSGILNVANGGTGQDFSAVPANNLIYTSATGTMGNVGIGTTGQVLTYAGGPGWANLPTPALTLVSNTSFSAANTSGSISITNTNFYRVNFWIRNNTAASALWFRFNTDTGGNYNYAFDGRTTGGAITGGAAGATKIILNTAAIVSAYTSGELYIFPQQGTSDPLYVFGKVTYTDTAGTLLTYVDVSGNWIPSPGANATSFAIIDDGGGATLTGNIYLYKYSQS